MNSPDAPFSQNDSLRTEDEIVTSWVAEMPLVSIVCNSYNHRDTIEAALKGFLSQVTDFAFEIWVNDDASSDGTQGILEEYRSLYPRIIKLILHRENQFSLGRRPVSFTIGAVNGKYIALCEGDDYWINNSKLATQVAVLEDDEGIGLCTHPAVEFNCRTKATQVICKLREEDGFVDVAQIVCGGGGVVPTASLLMRGDIYKNAYSISSSAPVGDFFFQSYAAVVSKVFFLRLPMSVYRKYNADSWTSRNTDIKRRQLYFQQMAQEVDKFYGELLAFPGSRLLKYPISSHIISATRIEFSFSKINSIRYLWNCLGALQNLKRAEFFKICFQKIFKRAFRK